MKTITAATLALLAILAAPVAHADPCRYQVVDYCRPNPPYNGPLFPSWDTPGTNSGWTTLPLLCNPVARTCQQVAPNPN